MMNYGADIYTVQCGQTRNAVARIHLRVILMIFAQGERVRNTSVICNQKL